MSVLQQTITISRKTLYELSRTYQSRQEVKISVELAMSLIAIIIFGLFAVKPTLVTIGELRTVIEDKKAVVADLETKIKNLGQATIVYENEKQRIQLLNIAVPEEPSVGNDIRQIEGLAKKNQITIIGLNFEDVPLVGEIEKDSDEVDDPTTSETTTLSFIINTSGDYSSLLSFWVDLEQMRRPVVNHSISFVSPEGDEANTGQINLTIGGNTPYYKTTDLK